MAREEGTAGSEPSFRFSSGCPISPYPDPHYPSYGLNISLQMVLRMAQTCPYTLVRRSNQ